VYVNSPMCSDAIAVFGGWVTFVRVPAVVRMLLVVFEHEVVSSGFRQYGRCRYVAVFAIAPNDTVVRNVLVGLEFIAVSENGFGYARHGGYGTLHGFYGSV